MSMHTFQTTHQQVIAIENTENESEIVGEMLGHHQIDTKIAVAQSPYQIPSDQQAKTRNARRNGKQYWSHNLYTRVDNQGHFEAISRNHGLAPK